MTTPFNTDPPLVEPPYLAHRRSVEDVEKLDPRWDGSPVGSRW